MVVVRCLHIVVHLTGDQSVVIDKNISSWKPFSAMLGWINDMFEANHHVMISPNVEIPLILHTYY